MFLRRKIRGATHVSYRMAVVGRLWFCTLLPPLACQVEHEEVVDPDDSRVAMHEPERTAEAQEPPAPAVDPVPAEPRSSPEEDELLVLDTVYCHVTGAQDLVDCEHDWEALLRTKAAPAWALCRLRPDEIRERAPRHGELWRGSFAVGDPSDQRLAPWCAVERVDARVDALEHGIEALSDNMLHEVALGATADELQGAPDL